MTIFYVGSIVRVPFPHVERLTMVPRPAVVVTSRGIGPSGLVVWVVMITNANRPGWPGDIPIADWKALGLIIPSKVRAAKISTVEVASATPIGRLDQATMAEVVACIACGLGFTHDPAT